MKLKYQKAPKKLRICTANKKKKRNSLKEQIEKKFKGQETHLTDQVLRNLCIRMLKNTKACQNNSLCDKCKI